MFRAVPLPIVRSFPLYMTYTSVECIVENSWWWTVPNSLHPTSIIYFRIRTSISHLFSLPQAVILPSLSHLFHVPIFAGPHAKMKYSACTCCSAAEVLTATMFVWGEAHGCRGRSTPAPTAHLTSQHSISMQQIHSCLSCLCKKLIPPDHMMSQLTTPQATHSPRKLQMWHTLHVILGKPNSSCNNVPQLPPDSIAMSASISRHHFTLLHLPDTPAWC
jgi:hypothetical protein